MNPSLLASSLLVGIAAATAALAETPYERNQREQLEKYQREHGSLPPDVEQRLRWEREWKAQHPGQPLPSAGALQKLHRDETSANIRAGFADMRARRQAELRREHQMARDHQARQNAAQHITWSPAQWQAWERQYDLAQQRKAQDYLKAVELSGEMARREKEREEDEKRWKQK